MSSVYFLSASKPLTKTFTLSRTGEIEKHPYPPVKLVTSHEERITSLKEFFTALVAHAAKNHCLLKGTITQPLVNQSRKASTKTETLTDWLCLDLDRAPFKTPSEFMNSIPCLKDVAHIVQYSASHGLLGAVGLSCHIFVLLSKPHNPTYIKAWLMHQNLNNPTMRAALTLTRSKAYLHWPLDITTCQNDKLLYIAPPILGAGVKYSLSKNELIQFIPGKEPSLNPSLLVCDSIELSSKAMRAMINHLRAEAGITKLTSRTKYIKEHEVQCKPGVCTITGIKENNDFVYFNIDGGDSWGYFHPIGKFEIIHNFKGEMKYETKEIFPDYYAQCKEERIAKNIEPTEEGLIVLGIRNRRTSKLHNVTWDATTHELEVLPADNIKLLDDFLKGYGKNGHTETEQPIPTWTLDYDPYAPEGVNTDTKSINRFITTPLMRAAHIPAKDMKKCPTIEKIILSAVGGNQHCPTVEHFLNWLACILQHKIKTQTAWVLHGNFGTGKQLLVNKIIRPVLGDANITTRRASELEEKFTAWMEDKLVVFIDEIQVSASQRKDLISSDLKNFITDSPVTIRHMNRVSYEAPNYVNIIFGSNMPDPVVVEKNDRRYNIGVFQHTRLAMTDHEIDVLLPKELPAFCNYIMTRKADKELAKKIIDNESRRDVISANRNSLDMVAEALLDGDLEFLYDSMPDTRLLTDLHGANTALPHAYSELIKREITQLYLQNKQTREGLCYDGKLSRDELSVIFQYCIGNMPTQPNKFTRLLKHHGIVTKKIWHNNIPVMGLPVVWKVSPTWAAEHKAQFMETKIRRVK